MGCLPESGGCERQRTDPFVDHLNRVEGRVYRHDRCLDRIDRTRPQPEALYIEDASNAKLVIERKSIVWPSDYVVRHKSEHDVVDLIREGLRDLTGDEPYRLVIEQGLRGSPNDLERLAAALIESIRSKSSALHAGRGVSSQPSGLRWTMYRENAAQRDFNDEPPTGFLVEIIFADVNVPSDDAGLLTEIGRHLDSSAVKFSGYPDARRVLVLDPHADIRHDA